jgi:hypothetical protein
MDLLQSHNNLNRLMQVNDGLYAEVPLWCASGQVGRVRVFQELLAVFNCSVLTSGVQ